MPWQDSKNVLIGQKKMGLTYYNVNELIDMLNDHIIPCTF